MKENKELDFIIDQLSNNDVSSDDELSKFLANETKHSLQRMQMLVSITRGYFLKNPMISKEDATRFIKEVLIKIDNSY